MITPIKEIIENLKKEIKLKEGKAKKLVLEKEAEEKLYELITFKEWLDKEIENLKKEIVNQAEKLDRISMDLLVKNFCLDITNQESITKLQTLIILKRNLF